MREEYCHGEVAIEAKRKAMTPKDGDLPPGIKFTPDPYSIVGKPLSSYRDAHWEAVLAERTEKVAERQERIDAYLDSGSSL